MRKTILLLTIINIILTGCGNELDKKKSIMVFIDYTKSAATFENYNSDRIKKIIERASLGLKNGDLLEVYPIHRFTETGIMGKTEAPILKGSLIDKQLHNKWIEDEVKVLIEYAFSYNFDDKSLAGTNIYPVINKIKERKSQGYDVAVYMFSDLIQEFDNESFQILFNGDEDPIEYAVNKVSSFKLEESLKSVKTSIFIPGVPEGVADHENARQDVERFWKKFFTLCGSSVIIKDLG
tara:strand:- start:326 stop:1036 length:711 start_codon:yes stop_codon:yes gene_type:complete